MYNRINESEFEVKTSEFSTRQVVSTPWGKAFKASSSLSCRAISFHEPRRTLDRLSSDTRHKHVKSCFRVVSIPWIHVFYYRAIDNFSNHVLPVLANPLLRNAPF